MTRIAPLAAGAILLALTGCARSRSKIRMPASRAGLGKVASRLQQARHRGGMAGVMLTSKLATVRRRSRP